MYASEKPTIRLLVRITVVLIFTWLLWIFGTAAVNHFRYIPVSFSTSEGDSPLIFIGGHPRSGTTLMRVLLDVHPDIRCGPETLVIPKILRLLKRYSTGYQNDRISAANLYPCPMKKAFIAFILTLLELAGDDAPVLCNKDPLALLYIKELHEIFPKAKYVNMIRDGRAVVASMVKRNIRMRPYNLSFEGHLRRWDATVTTINKQCGEVGPALCQTFRYEDVVLRPNQTMHKILEFVGVPWNPVVLKHTTQIGSTTVLSRMEPSTSQVMYPIHLEALSSWAANTSVLSHQFIRTAHLKSDMLKVFGYAKLSIPPDYGQAEPEIVKQNEEVKKSEKFWGIFSSNV